MKEKIKGYFKKLIKILKKPEMAILPANIAFYLILALIPLLTIIVLLASSFNLSINLVADLINNIMPKQVSSTIIDVISGKGFDGNVGFFNIMAFVLASNGTYAIITTSNALYKVTNTDYLKNRISSMFILIDIIILFLFLLIVPVFGENIISIMQSAKILENYADETLALFNLIRWPITLFITYVNIKLIYTVAPSKNIQSKETTMGAAFTTIMWSLATIVFRFYLQYFARYDILYGNLSTLIIMMVWVYFLSYIFVLGLAINASRREEQEILEETQRLELASLQEKKKKKKKRFQRRNKKEEPAIEEVKEEPTELQKENEDKTVNNN